MNFNEITDMIYKWGGAHTWVVQLFFVVLLVLLTNFIARRLLTKLHQHLQTTNNPWDDAFVDAIKRPLAWLIWVLGFSIAAEIARAQSDSVVFNLIEPVREVGVIICIAWFLMRLISNMSDSVLQRSQKSETSVDKATADAISKLTRLAVIITTILVIMQTMGFSVSGVLAFGGMGGIAIGFAAKDLLANFFGGLMIYLDRPFSVGDWIRSPDREIEGTVEYIGWRLTRIRSFSKRPIYVPNSAFANIAVVNPSRMTHRRISETIGIRYDDIGKMRIIVEKVRTMLMEHNEIDQSQTMIVNFNAFSASSVDFMIYTFTRTVNWVHYHQVKQDVLLSVADIIIAEGAEIAYPTTTVHIPDMVSQGQS